MKDELGGNVMKEFVLLRQKKCSYLTDNNDWKKNNKRNKKNVYKKKLKFKDYRNYLKATQLENKINKLEKQKLNENVRNF